VAGARGRFRSRRAFAWTGPIFGRAASPIRIAAISAVLAMPAIPLAQTFTEQPLTETTSAPPTAEVPIGMTPAPGQEMSGQEAPGLPSDLSAWSMFLSADWVVKGVMISLAFASLVTWTVLIAKSIELARAMRRQRAASAAIREAASLSDMARRDGIAGVAAAIVDAAHDELRLSGDALHDKDGLKERIAGRLERIEAEAARRMTRGTGVLATIGATAPFVGLFGTVWGIMNSFIGISKAQTTNLAVVAPGIAEALLATAIGLVAAIPAVVFYNHLARRIALYKALVADTSAGAMRLVSRDLSRGVRRMAPIGASKAAE